MGAARMSIESQLQAASGADTLIRLYRDEFEDGSVNGYVAALGETYVAIALVDEAIRFNGFQCLKHGDVTDLEAPHPHAEFVSQVLERRALERPRWPGLDLASTEALLRSALAATTLLSIHVEYEDPDVCFIGQPAAFDAQGVRLVSVTPDGTWAREPMDIPFQQISRVDFGGGYEDALWLVAGPPPKSAA